MAADLAFDQQVRAAAMGYLAEHRAAFADEFPREFLLRGFTPRTERSPYKPRVLGLPLSILTTPAKLGEPRP